MRAGVHAQYLTTLGGGERYAGAFASVLASEGFDVDLIGPEQIPIEELEDRLRLDLSGVNVRVAPIDFDNQIATLSAEYDLFLNTTYLSTAMSVAKRSYLVVHFPETGIPKLRRRGLAPDQIEELRDRVPQHGFGKGFRPTDPMQADRTGHWIEEEGLLHLGAETPERLTIEVGLPDRGPSAVADVEFLEGDRVLATCSVEAGRFETVDLVRDPSSSVLTVRSTGFVPALARHDAHEDRFVGAVVRWIVPSEYRRLLTSRRGRSKARMARAARLNRLDSYDRLIANSSFTAGWVTQAWGRDADVIPPACDVTVPEVPERDQIIAVGRFFPRGDVAHNKRQLEMVETYVAMPEEFKRRWRFVLVGGLAPAASSYLRDVQAAARGENVEFYVNAPGHVLEDKLAASRIFWHATGLGDSEERHPERQEHFGITTVEAMTAGCVPVVIDAAGQREIVRHEQDGFRWGTLDELASRTLQLASDRDLLQRFRDRAIERSRAFSLDAFRDRLIRILDEDGLR